MRLVLIRMSFSSDKIHFPFLVNLLPKFRYKTIIEIVARVDNLDDDDDVVIQRCHTRSAINTRLASRSRSGCILRSHGLSSLDKKSSYDSLSF